MNPTNSGRVQGSGGQVGRESNLEIAQAAQARILAQIGLNPEQLGPSTKKESTAVLAELMKQAGTGGIDEGTLQAMGMRLQRAHVGDLASSFKSGRAPIGEAAQLPARGTPFLKQSKDGSVELVGVVARPGHGVSKLLAKLGIDPKKVDPEIADVLDLFLKKPGFALSSQKDFDGLGRALAQVQAERGQLGAGVIAEAAKAEQAAKVTTGPVPQGSIEGGTRNQGLMARAPTTTGTGTKNNAVALLARNMATNKAQDSQRQQGVSDLAGVLAGEGFEKLSTAEKKTLTETLDKVLTDRGSTDGTSRPVAVMANAFKELAAKDPGAYGLAAEMAEAMQKAMGNRTTSPGLDKAFTEVASSGLTTLVASKLGRDEQLDPKVTQKMAGLLREIGGEQGKKFVQDLRAQVKSVAAEKTGAEAKIEGAKEAVSPEVAKAVDAAMSRLKLEGNREEYGRIRAELTEVFKKGTKDEEVALNAFKHLDAKLGVDSGMTAQVEELVKFGLAPDQATALRDRAISAVAQYAANTELAKAQVAQARSAQVAAMAGGAGGGNGVPPGGPGIGYGSPEIPSGNGGGIPTMWNAQPEVAGMGTAGVLGPSHPRDADPARQSMYAQRTAVIGSILNDPSLSIEDKIFLFMMWFAAFADKEREAKMKEIVDLDKIDQKRRNDMDRANRERTAMYASKRDLTTAADGIEKELTKLKGQLSATIDPTADTAEAKASRAGASGKVEELEKQLGEAKDKVNEAQTKINRLSEEYDTLKNATNQAPKSREILLFELDRITQLRGSIMDMARHFLEDSTRRIKEIMR
ncbi:MAG: hypothetical protein HY791_35275 [Deltaproteobacteria bacterium]|nr:hypothetical protein [Deltaproteobacteria bacterium]